LLPTSSGASSVGRPEERGRKTPTVRSTENIELIRLLEERACAQRSLGVRVSVANTAVIGTVSFVVFHVLWFGTWSLINSGVASGLIGPFDPFPLGVLTLAVSAEGVLLALFVLSSQHRLMRDADRRALIDLHVNLLTERSSIKTLQILQQISKRLDIREVRRDPETAQLAHPTSLVQLIDDVDRSLVSQEMSAPETPILPRRSAGAHHWPQ
jgi:uncharacterized membrane protein